MPTHYIYTIGYENITLNDLLTLLKETNINTIIDIRKIPLSRKEDFSKTQLPKICSINNIIYYHFGNVGIPSIIRHNIKNKQQLWNYYHNNIIPNNKQTISQIANICKQSPSILLCVENKPEHCHRHILAHELNKLTQLPIMHFVINNNTITTQPQKCTTNMPKTNTTYTNLYTGA